MKKTTRNVEYQRFESLTRQLVGVSHAELKAKLDAEKKEKASRPKQPKKAPS